MASEFDFSVDIQDQIICLMAENTTFLDQCVRRRIESSYFSSEMRQMIVSMVLSHYRDYMACPGYDNLEQLVIDEIVKNHRIKDEDLESYYQILKKISLKKATDKAGWLLDRMDLFIKKRVVYNVTNKLAALQDRVAIDPDVPLSLMREAIDEIESKTGRQLIESLTDGDVEKSKSDIVGRFNIAPIDQAAGGGLSVGSFVVIVGYTNIGKSWCATHLAKMATRLGESPLLIDLERSNRAVKQRLRMCFTGMSKEELASGDMPVESIVRKSLIKKSRVILVNDEEKHMKVSELPGIIENAREKYGVRPRLIIIDSADDLSPPEGSYRERIDRTTAIYTWLKNYAKDAENDVCIVTTTQAQRKSHDSYWVSGANVGDDINKVRKATLGLSINGKDDEIQKGYLRLWVFKNTDGLVGTRVWIKRKFDRGQFIVDWGEFISAEKHLELIRAAT